MIGHGQALNGIETIMEYCKEHFPGNEHDCQECIFHHRRCMIPNLMGVYGKDVAKLSKEIIIANYEELKCKKKL